MWIIVSGFAGWLAGKIMKGTGYGIFWNIILGIIGGYLGKIILNALQISTANNNVGILITSVIGAVALIFISGIISGKR